MYYIQFYNSYNIIFFYRNEDSDVNSKDFIETVNRIVKDSKEVAKIAAKVAQYCTDTHLKSVSYRDFDNKIVIHSVLLMCVCVAKKIVINFRHSLCRQGSQYLVYACCLLAMCCSLTAATKQWQCRQLQNLTEKWETLITNKLF